VRRDEGSDPTWRVLGVRYGRAAARRGGASAAIGRRRLGADGDTFRLESGERIRIAGIDAPETQPGNARCRAELVRGKQATQATIALLKGRTVEIERVGRSYNRTVARVRLDGRDLAGTLVEKGNARWWPRGRARPDWCRG
jgi:micrococcal nuclease